MAKEGQAFLPGLKFLSEGRSLREAIKRSENVSLLLNTYLQVSRRVGFLYPRDRGKMAEDLAIAGRVGINAH
ncbi:hypothetical protein BFU36_12585 [Sulfolobus sp. A20]|uniref:hypothetical protein n=1 Tax=Sulfolobaceae TaxID=118883 RepID=UPI000845F466|nr:MULTISPECIES: hypothetical protein [unclassified Sulfolobus]AOL17412.1 hypothetical protein BFU36_12585 [Sulfolobus sp. A20]